MHILHTIIGLPKVTERRIAQEDFSQESVFDITPLPRGYGMTLGHALRRAIISSIPGTRVTGIKIEGVSHEYTTLPGLHESVLDIMLNLKNLVLDKSDTGVTWLTLKKNKAGKVTAADIKTGGGVEILNKDLYITEIDRDGFELDMQIRVEKNVGYKSIETLKKEDDDVMILVVDASFSPVINVSTDVRSERYGDMTDLDNLALTVKTNGSITPESALKFGAQMLRSYFDIFCDTEVMVESEFMGDVRSLREKEKKDAQATEHRENFTHIDFLGLSPRTLNALVNGNILSVEQLEKCTEAKLSSIKGFGKKAMDEVRAALATQDKKLLGDD
ncbi:DNA-directed RNA polymerase subunit alpha [Candidatus Peribacteria bacterium]|nr:DNA-directed RNA polymerase subunit alpha [Candidatus Peribacteria bacterium]